MRWTHERLARLGIVLRPTDDLSKVRVWTPRGKKLLQQMSEAELRESLKPPPKPAAENVDAG